MTIADVFSWLGDAVTGSLEVLGLVSDGAGNLLVKTTADGITPSILGILVIAGVGAPLAWKFVRYIISLFNKVKPN